jgi:hypothetical protein
VRRWRAYAVVAVALAAAAFAIQAVASNPDATQRAALSVKPYEGTYWGHNDSLHHYRHFHYIGTVASGTISDFHFSRTAFFSRVSVSNGEFQAASGTEGLTGHWCNSHHLKGTLHVQTDSGVTEHHWHAHWPNARFYPDYDPNEGGEPCT